MIDSQKPNSTPPWTPDSTVGSDYTLQQLAPYIGRMKTSIARSLVLEFTEERDLVVDPFCGSGVLPFEAAIAGRRTVSGDWNPYAILLTRAKLFAPPNFGSAMCELETLWLRSREKLVDQDLRSVPLWVRNFFHPDTLRSALAFRDACVEANNHFLLACLLGILHHERPGFLSYPSSHLVPYLRNHKYPRDGYPELYDKREVYIRLEKKVTRAYKRPAPTELGKCQVFFGDAREFPEIEGINAVITSPPYMNELDYVRDNRLRLWFLLRSMPPNLDSGCKDRLKDFRTLLGTVCGRVAQGIVDGGVIILILGDATRGNGRPGRTSEIALDIFLKDERLRRFRLEQVFQDTIPDLRRSRRTGRGAKMETVLAFRKVKDR